MNSHKNVIESLIELGLSQHDAEIYLIILKEPECSAGMILNQVQLHREQVYRALKRLSDSGLITSFEKNKRSYFSTINPEILINKSRAKLELAESIQPYLKELRKEKTQIINIKEGIRAFEELFDDILLTLKKNNEYLVLNGSGEDFFALTADFYPRFARLCKKKKISVRMIGYNNQDFYNQILEEEFLRIRKLPGELAYPTPTLIYGNKIAIQIIDRKNPAIITIENKKIADSYHQTFETLWKSAA